MSPTCHDPPGDAAIRKPEAIASLALTVALAGRPNSGKSSIYNALTGGDAHVGNYPGITVDILEGTVMLPSGAAATVADLPGFYSVEATVDNATDEGVAREFLRIVRRDHRALVLVQVLDPTRLALGLRLTAELLRAKFPLLVVLTHEDILSHEGHSVNVPALSDSIGAPVVLVNARDAASKARILAAVEDLYREGNEAQGDGTFDPELVARSVMEDVGKDAQRQRRLASERLDAVLLHPFLGPVLFVGIMAVVFAAVFLVADPASSLMDSLIGLTRAKLASLFGKNLFTSFVADGLLGGAGTVLAFMPQIVILTVALEFLEASGYLARGAFLVDRLLRVMGLGGRSFLPLLMGHACAVPAIAATRIIRDPRERLTAILVIPLVTCSARLPTYGLVLSTFFGHRSAFFRALLFVGLYFAGIFAALVASLVLRRTATRGKSLPLVLEIPAYRVPQWRVLLRKAAQASRRFLRDVGTVIVAVSAVLWLLLTIPMPGSESPKGIERSVAASIGRSIEPVTRIAGFDWRINVGLIGSFGAREVMVGTMGVIFGVEDAADDPTPLTKQLRESKNPDGTPTYSTASGLALLAFFVLACQCMSTVAALRRETASLRWPAFVVAYTYALGYAAAILVFQVGRLLGVR